MTSRWEEAKRIPIDEVAHRLGISLSSRTGMRCPFPGHDDKTPSFSINRKKNLCFCHACGRGGSVIDFASIVTGRQPAEIVSWLSRSIDRNRPSKYVTASTEQMSAASKRATNDAYDNVANPRIYERLLSLCPPTSRGSEYLGRRAISQSTQAAFRIGYIEYSRDVIDQLLGVFGEEALLKCGLIFPNKPPELVFPSGSLLIPFIAGDEITYFQSRSISNTSKRWMGLNGVRKPVFNADAAFRARSIYVCEGVTDTLSAFELRLPAIGLTGANTPFPEELLRSMRNKTAYLVPDNDESGRSMEERMIALFRKSGIQCVIQRVPHGKDLNDYLVWRKRL
jgi:DNA primase